MIVPPGPLRVLVATRPVDFRKGMDGLAAFVQEQLGTDPFSGVIYVFRAKRADHTSFYIPIAVRCRSLSLAPTARRTSACSATARQARSTGSSPRGPFGRLVGASSVDVRRLGVRVDVDGRAAGIA